ncbi:MAG: MtnX-like HAD-IB family phosphatase [Desulfobacterota bacterium]|nr:MtnX-like HAD-IB family phosphatase [Thermodesulfobacteriota bacterium]
MTEQFRTAIAAVPQKASVRITNSFDGCHALSDCMVFFDFDNTLTPFDVLDGVIEKFSINHDWIAYEEAWRKGKIGSRQCLEGQLRSVRVTKKELTSYLSDIEVDPSLHRLLALLRNIGIKAVILSDSFSFMIDVVLKNNGITGITVYSNKIRFYKDRLIPSFPYTNNLCSHCAHCKTSTLSNEAFKNNMIVYAGDGLSDICPACHADIVFAKNNGSLLKYFNDTGRECFSFDTLGEMYTYFMSMQKAAAVACP